MRCFAWLRVGGALLLALLSAAFISGGAASAAQPSARPDSQAACAGKLNGYTPDAEQVYGGIIGVNQQLFLENVKERAGGDISGTAAYLVDGYAYPGTFTGTIESGSVKVQGSITDQWGFTLSGDATCLLSKISSTDFTTDPPAPSIFNSYVQLTSDCSARALSNGESVACVARQILDGIPQALWHNDAPILDDGDIPYSFGGGHPHLGPTTGTCVGYTGPHSSKKSLKPCEDWKYGPTHTVGLDCTGFTRWVFDLTFGKDVLGSGGTKDPQSQRTRPGVHADHGSAPSIGDLVYFKTKSGAWHHVGILIAPGVVIDEPQTGDLLSVDRITRSGFGTPYYYAYVFIVP